MCSGCFGDYEEPDDGWVDDTDDEGPAGAVDTAAGSAARVQDDPRVEDQYEVFVGRDYIVELRILKANSLSGGPLHAKPTATAQHAAPTDFEHSPSPSAKYYRTSPTSHGTAGLASFFSSKRLIAWGLLIALAAMAVLWRMRA